MAKRSWGLLVDLHVKVPNSYKFKSPMVDEYKWFDSICDYIIEYNQEMKLILKNLEMNIEEKKYLGKQFVCYHCYHYKKNPAWLVRIDWCGRTLKKFLTVKLLKYKSCSLNQFRKRYNCYTTNFYMQIWFVNITARFG